MPLVHRFEFKGPSVNVSMIQDSIGVLNVLCRPTPIWWLRTHHNRRLTLLPSSPLGVCRTSRSDVSTRPLSPSEILVVDFILDKTGLVPSPLSPTTLPGFPRPRRVRDVERFVGPFHDTSRLGVHSLVLARPGDRNRCLLPSSSRTTVTPVADLTHVDTSDQRRKNGRHTLGDSSILSMGLGSAEDL